MVDVPDVVRLEVDPGTRVLVTSDLHLREVRTDASAWATGELVRLLDAWQGPGVLALAGDVLELWAGAHPRAQTALDAHPDLVRAISGFAAGAGRRVLYLVGNHDGRVAWDAETIDVVIDKLCCELTFAAEVGVRGVPGSTVRMEHGHAYDPANAFDDPRDPHSSPLGQHIVQEFLPSLGKVQASWLDGVETLVDPKGFPALIASRMFYRKIARESLWFLLPVVIVALLRVPLAYVVLDGELERLQPFTRGLLVADLMIVATLVVTAGLLLIVVQRWWRTANGIVAEQQGAQQNDSTRKAAAEFVDRRFAGMVCGHTHHSELSAVGAGFYANTGSGTKALDRVDARLRFPSVFLPRLQTSWVLLEAVGDDGGGPPWRVTLTQGRRSLPGPNGLERLLAKQGSSLLPEPVPVDRYP